MSDEAAFLRAIEQSPDEDAPRLVFADWLADRDDPRSAWVRDPLIWEWMRPDARDPLPALVAMLGDRTDWPRMWRARAVLQKLGDRAMQAVCDWLREDPSRWPELVRDDPPPADLKPLDELLALVAADDWGVALRAILHLRYHGPCVETIRALVPLAERGLREDPGNSDNTTSIDAAINTLSTFGPAADATVPAMARHLWDADCAFGALRWIRPDPEIVYQNLDAPDNGWAWTCVGMVEMLDEDSPRMLIRILTDQGERWPRGAAEVIEGLADRGELQGSDEVLVALLATLPVQVAKSGTGVDSFCETIVRAILLISETNDDRSALPVFQAALADCEANPERGSLRKTLTDAIATLSR